MRGFVQAKPPHHVSALLVAAVVLCGCSDDPFDAVYADLDIVQRDGGALEGAGSINGTYTDCIDRSGEWSLPILPGASLDYPELSVVSGDTDCELTLTEIVLDDLALEATPPLPLGVDYAPTASAFAEPLAFSANARLDSVDFDDDFELTIVVSDEFIPGSGSSTADFDVIGSALTMSTVTAPDYVLDLTGLSLQTSIGGLVQAISGSATLTPGSTTGHRYAVVPASGLTSYSAVHLAYLTAISAPMDTTIPASAFSLLGTGLSGTQVRTLIVSRTVAAVTSYQTFEVTFHPAG